MDEDRLAALERTVARQRRALRWQWVAFAVVGAACLLGQAPSVPDVVTCHALKVVDKNGQPIAAIGQGMRSALDGKPAMPFNDFTVYRPGGNDKEHSGSAGITVSSTSSLISTVFGDTSVVSLADGTVATCWTDFMTREVNKVGTMSSTLCSDKTGGSVKCGWNTIGDSK